MTLIGMDYLKHQETVRSNKARENEDQRSHRANEHINFGNLSELYRSNLEREKHNRDTLAETQAWHQGTLDESVRSNQAKEQLEREKQSEVQRHNVKAEEQAWDELVEKHRSNTMTEYDAARRASLEERKIKETERSNVAKETETSRSNKAKEAQAKSDEISKLHQSAGTNLTRINELSSYTPWVSEGAGIVSAVGDAIGRLLPKFK